MDWTILRRLVIAEALAKVIIWIIAIILIGGLVYVSIVMTGRG